MTASVPVVEQPHPITAQAGPDVRPALVLDLELAEPILPIDARFADGRAYREVWLLVRLLDEPLGLVTVDAPDGAVGVAAIRTAVQQGCEALIRERAAAAGLPVDALLAGRGLDGPRPSFAAAHAEVLESGPHITVVICTRNRPADLARAIDSLQRQTYRRCTVLVVDNAPTGTATARLVASLAQDDERLSYTTEPRPGLSWARNHALSCVEDGVVAWLDDDEVADQHWLAELAAAFVEHPGAAAVSGSVVPAELETQAQLWFEQYGGHSKGRGFRPAVFRGRECGGQSPLYPLPAFGVGANMAFDVAALRRLGGFDPALGAGTATLGGEDTKVFSQLLLAGHTVVYRPSALTRHYHRRDYASLAGQMRGYGIGLTAYYASLVRSDWRLVVPLARLLPAALRDVFGSRGDRLSGVPADFPRELLRAKTRGMLLGPWLYARARRTARALREPS